MLPYDEQVHYCELGYTVSGLHPICNLRLQHLTLMRRQKIVVFLLQRYRRLFEFSKRSQLDSPLAVAYE